ncbi:MAG: MMPL family transporter [Polyangiaceae bacterium]|nr:MMPL family transporter [Polyangiaceae bacterium]
MDSPSPSSRALGGPVARAITHALGRVLTFQITRPYVVLFLVALITAASTFAATKLTVRTGFESLLPENRKSVQELDRVAERTAGVSTIFIVLEGDDKLALRKAGDALVPALKQLGPPWVGAVEDGVHDAVAFMGPRAGLFAELKRLEKLRADVDARYEYEVAKATGADLGLDDEKPPEINGETIKKELGLKDEDTQRFPDGYYQSQDGKTLIVAIRAGVLSSDFDRANEALRRVREVIETVKPASFHPSIRYGLTGDLVIGLSEYKAINEDLTEVGLTGTVLLVLVVLLYYLRVRMLVAMTLTIGVGVAWTFGLTKLMIGHLNMATGFLFTIVAGNGINFAIIFMARYLEARRAGASTEVALRMAQRETWIPTLTASLAAGAAYASLMVTEFRGFRDFGAIGGAGMFLCWLGTFAVLPSILVVSERLAPLDKEKTGVWGKLRKATEKGIAFGRPFAFIAESAPRFMTVTGVVLAIAGAVLTVRYFTGNPMEYDLNNLQSKQSDRAKEEQRLIKLAKDITGYVGLDGMAILVNKPEQVESLKAELEKRRDAAAPHLKPFQSVVTLQDFVPKEQEAKVPVLLALKERVMRAKKRGLINDADWEKVKDFIPPDDLKPFGIADLPEGIARLFTEKDGVRGRIVYITPTEGELTSDAKYLFRWADSFRETKIADGTTIYGSGRAVIYADMWAAVIEDVPPAVLASFIATLLVVVLAFRAGKPALIVLASLLIGVSWMTGSLALGGVKLNFLNFIALPLTFGIGVDYAVNIMQRYRVEGPGSALQAVRSTGGAVVLCSLTTLLGYLALVRSNNYAVRSMGVAAVLGEATCLIGAVLVLPAALTWLDQKRTKTSAQ